MTKKKMKRSPGFWSPRWLPPIENSVYARARLSSCIHFHAK